MSFGHELINLDNGCLSIFSLVSPPTFVIRCPLDIVQGMEDFQDVLLERWGKNRRGSKLGDSDASEASNGASAISQWVPIGWLPSRRLIG